MASAFDDMNDELFTEDMGAVSVSVTPKGGSAGTVTLLPASRQVNQQAQGRQEERLFDEEVSFRNDEWVTAFGRTVLPDDVVVYKGETYQVDVVLPSSDEFVSVVSLARQEKVAAYADESDRIPRGR